MKEKGIIFLNGEPRALKELEKLDLNEYFTVCADGALNYLRGVLKPDLIVGDFDSADNTLLENEFKDVKKIEYEKNKDLTDGFLAVRHAALNGVKSLLIFGAFGKRLDHEYQNYDLLSYCENSGIETVLKDGIFDVYFVSSKKRGGAFSFHGKEGKVLSIVAFSASAHIIDTEGLLYPCKNLTFVKTPGKELDGYVSGMSNLFTAPLVKIKIGDGAALVFKER